MPTKPIKSVVEFIRLLVKMFILLFFCLSRLFFSVAIFVKSVSEFERDMKSERINQKREKQIITKSTKEN